MRTRTNITQHFLETPSGTTAAEYPTYIVHEGEGVPESYEKELRIRYGDWGMGRFRLRGGKYS